VKCVIILFCKKYTIKRKFLPSQKENYKKIVFLCIKKLLLRIMYPDLSYFLHDILPSIFDRDGGFSIIKTFGLLLATAFLASAYFLTLEFRRKEAEGILLPRPEKVTVGEGATPVDLVINSLIGFFIGFKFLFALENCSAFKADAAGVIASSKGNLLGGIVGLVLFAGYHYWSAQKTKLATPETRIVNVFPHSKIGDITIVAAIFGLLGAKLFSVMEEWQKFIQDPINQLFSGSGLTMYGGLILAFIACYIYVKKIGIPPIQMMDAVAPALVVGYGVGRLGCQLSGDGDWGIVNTAPKPEWMSFLPDWLWSQKYAHNVLGDGEKIKDCVGNYCNELIPPVFPTPLYESMMCLVMLGILWYFRKKIKTAGVLFFLYLILNGAERFLIETIRVNPRYEAFGNLSQAQIIAVGLMTIGVIGAGILLLLKKK
jgi:phosphatidylglycerol---prolipoprotein diacylglyceryl transferase